jgi:hypothetical protein
MEWSRFFESGAVWSSPKHPLKKQVEFLGTQKGVLISDSYQGKQLTVQGKDTLTHNDAKKIKLH